MKRQINKPKICVLLSKVIISTYTDICAIKNPLLIFKSEDLSRAVHVTKSEANKHGE